MGKLISTRYYTLRVSGVRRDGIIFRRSYANHEGQVARLIRMFFELNRCESVIVEGLRELGGVGQGKGKRLTWEFMRVEKREVEKSA